MRQLASIQKILNITPIPNADNIETATILGWQCVVKKNEFKIGDLCIYCEIDSIMPDKPEFEFLRNKKFRIKTIKLRGQISQGICFSIDILKKLPEYRFMNNTHQLLINNAYIDVMEGLDVTDIIGVTKFDPYSQDLNIKNQNYKLISKRWWPTWLRKLIFKNTFLKNLLAKHDGNKTFPSVIPKTDETRVQALQSLLTKYKDTKCYYTEKLDGSSITIYKINNKIGVCSRNMDLKKSINNKYWKAVLDSQLDKKIKSLFKNTNVAIQGELIGPGIQANKYNLDKYEIRIFNIYMINQRKYVNFTDFIAITNLLNHPIVPVLGTDYILTDDIPALVQMSKGTSTLASTLREGIVIRPLEEIEEYDLNKGLTANRVSFKVINPDFLIKYDL